ncbi:MAG: ABC transporter permease [Bacteroidales bacterium]|nr:ABC transporter permease [Bacteroidales bacterium]
MIKNYLKIAIAHLIKSKNYSLISISSLSVGLAVCIMLLLYVQHELSYDRFHDKADHIYRLCQPEHPYHAPQVASLLSDKLPEIVKYTRIIARNDVIVQIGEQRFKEPEVAFVDLAFFSIFSFEFMEGNAETALLGPATVVITENIARKYFGDESPIDKIIDLGNGYNCTVKGVVEDIPQNSHFQYDIFVTLTNANQVFGEEMMNNSGWQNFLVYFQMQDGFSVEDVENKCNQLMKEPNDPEAVRPDYSLQNLKDIHLYSAHLENDIQPQNSINYVLLFSAIGILILLIACFNYINLLSANATKRTTEIGVRKMFGASPKQLALQFITESFLVIVLSLCLALVIVGLGLPIFNDLSGKVLSLSSLTQINTLLGLGGIVLITSLLAAWYPAFFLSSLKAVQVLKASKSGGGSKFHFREILVGTQFIIVIALIGCAIIMFRQIQYLKQKDLGFEKDYVLVSTVDDFGEEGKYNTLKHALLNQSMISHVSSASRVPSDDLSDFGGVRVSDQTEGIKIAYVHINYDYFETLGISAAQGRLYSNQFETDATNAVILNNAAVQRLGIQDDPIGQSIRCNWPKSERKIIGVLDDFHFESLYENIVPTVFVIYPEQCGQLMVKVNPSNIMNAVSTINEICEEVYPDQIFDFHFLDERLDKIYQADRKTFELMGYFTFLAVILACMGLFGMASFMLASRTKEIGIRKVNGSSVTEILQLLITDFVKWIAVAFVVATPLAWFFMDNWLESFAYKTTLSWWVFALAGFISLIIVLLTVSWMAHRAARRNPIEALRYE